MQVVKLTTIQTDTPLVSVLMTAYNRELYIAEAIESVLAQTYTNFELIIVDDQSKDRTQLIAKEYAAKDHRIRVYINENNLGDYPNRNRAISYAEGEYVMFVDSDDMIRSDSLAYIVAAFQNNVDAKHSSIYYRNDANEPFIYSSEEAIRSHLNGKNILSGGPGSRVFKREFLMSLGGYPEKYGPANDMYFNLKSTAAEAVLFLPYHYLFYREHPQQEKKNIKGYLHNNYLYFSDALSELQLPLSKDERKSLLAKNKKRLLVNLFKYLFSSFDLKGVLQILTHQAK